MYQPQLLVWAKSAPARTGHVNLKTTFLVSCVFIFSVLYGLPPQSLQAQSPLEIDLSEFEYGISVSGGTLDVNETGTVSFTLGTSSLPVSDVLGVRLDLVLSTNAYLPSNPLAVSVEGSWLFDDLEVSQSLTVESGIRTMHLELVLSNLVPQSGHGFVLSFPLVCAANDVSASSLIVSDGGIVIVENIDGRIGNFPDPRGNPVPVGVEVVDLGLVGGMSVTDADLPARDAYVGGGFMGMDLPPAAELVVAQSISSGQLPEPLHCYPNPTCGRLNVPVPDDGNFLLRLTGMDGRVYDWGMAVDGGIGVADIAPVARGIYAVEVLRDGVVLTRGRVMKE
jgi:hypothetical protein